VALILPVKKHPRLFPFPGAHHSSKKGDENMMKILKQLLFIGIITVCTSFAAHAQRQDDRRKPPPKDPPPKVVVKEKENDKPKDDRPRNDDRRNDNRGRRPEE
jgi:hypothetical protein